MNERAGNAQSRVCDWALLLHGSKRNEMLTLAEIEQYGLDSFADANYVSNYGSRGDLSIIDFTPVPEYDPAAPNGLFSLRHIPCFRMLL